MQGIDCANADRPSSKFAVIDLEDAYFQIPIWEGHYLRFTFDRRTFEFCVFPFGMSLAPPYIDKVHGRSPGTLASGRSSHPQSDWLVCTHSEEQCCNSVTQHLQHLGLCLNRVESRLPPSQSKEFLGMCLDAREGTLWWGGASKGCKWNLGPLWYGHS